MNRHSKKHILAVLAVMAVTTVRGAYADDLFDDSFLADPAPVNAVKTEPTADPVAQPAPVAEPAPAPVAEPALDLPAADTAAAPALDIPPMPMDISAPTDAMGPLPSEPSMDFGKQSSSTGMSAPPSEQILGKVSSDIFREMAEMERENNTLMLQLKREQLRTEIDALKTNNRQMLFDEIERREKMTQARLEWELAQDLKRQEALERKQRAEIRQKQIEAALKREEDRRIQKAKEEAELAKQKALEEEAQKEKEREEKRKKYNALSLVKLNNLKPTLMAATRPPKIKRSPSARISKTLTATGEDLLTKKKAGQALTTEVQEDETEKNRQPATSLYAVAEVRGTAGNLIAKLISKKDRTTFFAKKDTILPTGHTVIDIDKDFVLVQIGKSKEMIGFPSAGLLSEKPQQNNNANNDGGGEDTNSRAARRQAATQPLSASVSSGKISGVRLGGSSLAK